MELQTLQLLNLLLVRAAHTTCSHYTLPEQVLELALQSSGVHAQIVG